MTEGGMDRPEPTRLCELVGHKTTEPVMVITENKMYKRCEWCGFRREVDSISSHDRDATFLQMLASPLARFVNDEGGKTDTDMDQ